MPYDRDRDPVHHAPELWENVAYNVRKAAQTIAYLALKNGGRPLPVLKAVKLIYLADRESIARYGFPIQDEGRVSMEHGPVNSKTYSYINGEVEGGEADWAEFLRDREDHLIALARPDLAPTQLDELSDADFAVLDAVWEKFGQWDRWALVKWTHDPKNLPEWEDPGKSSSPIPLERIMQFAHVPNAVDQAALVREFDRIDSLFRSL